MSKIEKIKYKPISVRKLLLEMKNLSQLMVDLSYSSALYNDKDLANEVLALESRIDTLAYLLNLEVMVAARGDPKAAESLLGILIVASATNKLSDVAADIAAIVTRNIGIHPVVREVFEKVEEHLMKVTVKEKSEIVGKKILQLDLGVKMGVDIIAIRRNNEWILKPKKDERVFKNDILITRGAPKGIQTFKDLAEGSLAKLDQSQIQKFAEIVTRLVELKDTSELMIDLSYSSIMLNSRELAEEVQILEEKVDEMHTAFELLCLTSDFEKKEAPGFLGLIRLGVATEKIADAAANIAEVVLRGIEPHPVLHLTIKEAEETVIQACVTAKSQIVNKTLKEARVREETGMNVLIIKRSGKYLRPKGDSRIQVGDILIASGYTERAEALKQLASPEQGCLIE